MGLLSLAPRLPAYLAFRRLGRPSRLPFSLVISATFRCNSRCQTCNVWQKKQEELNDELTFDEWSAVFSHLKPAPYYLTFSGGEPFLRNDLVEMAQAAYRLCRPEVITIPTNGLLPSRIAEWTEAIVRGAPRSQIGINLSLDALGEEHDLIRGVPGNWDRALESLRLLKDIHAKNLTISIHTVISIVNVPHLPAIYAGLMDLGPDSYITEVAEERVELGTVGQAITPPARDYCQAAGFLIERLAEHPFGGFARITQAFRARYYDLACRILTEQRQIIPCHAGWASGHIAANGDVWTCCVRAESIGNIRETNYDLQPIWNGEPARRLRRSIAAGECACPMANASYSNMLLHPPTVIRVAWELATRRP